MEQELVFIRGESLYLCGSESLYLHGVRACIYVGQEPVFMWNKSLYFFGARVCRDKSLYLCGARVCIYVGREPVFIWGESPYL